MEDSTERALHGAMIVLIPTFLALVSVFGQIHGTPGYKHSLFLAMLVLVMTSAFKPWVIYTWSKMG